MKTVAQHKTNEKEQEDVKTPLDVLVYTEPDLRRTCKKVKYVDDVLKKAIDEMAKTMMMREGIGLAAPQVGIDKRFFLFIASTENLKEDEDIEIQVAINPQIIERDGESIIYEGCLSYPDHVAKVNRAIRIKVRFQDLDMRKIEAEYVGLAARVFQHELDHLDGILFIDRMEPDTLKHVDELDEQDEKSDESEETKTE